MQMKHEYHEGQHSGENFSSAMLFCEGDYAANNNYCFHPGWRNLANVLRPFELVDRRQGNPVDRDRSGGNHYRYNSNHITVRSRDHLQLTRLNPQRWPTLLFLGWWAFVAYGVSF